MTTYNYSGTVNAISWSPSTYRMLFVPSVDAALTPSNYSFTWPVNYFDSQLDFSVNIKQLLWGTPDTITSLTASVFPTDLNIIYTYGAGHIATIWVNGGSQGVTYNIMLSIYTQQGRIIPLSIALTIPGIGEQSGVLQYAIVQVPKSYVDNSVAAVNAVAQQALIIAIQARNVQTGVVIESGSAMTGFLGLTTADSLTGAGTTQGTATLLLAQLCVATSVPVNSGFILPTLAQGNGFLAPITFLNKDPANTATIYPPVGGQINNYGVNQGQLVSAGAQVTLIPGNTTGQWWA